MIISHQHKFIFVAIPKTGTHAIRFSLRPHLSTNDWEQVSLFKKSTLPFDELAQKKHGHITINEIKKYLSREEWQTYFKFTIVRNPWDRFISYCFFKMKNRMDALSSNPLPFMKVMIAHDKNFKNDLWSKPQSDFIIDSNDQLSVDFMLRQESLQQNFDELMKKLTLPLTPLEIVNSTEHKPYQCYYDNELKEMVKEYYKKDIELFNYTF